MLRSFLVITLRILWRNKVTSFVNIFSLSVGMAAFIFIMLYVRHETSYDKFNEKYDRIYRLEADDYARLVPRAGNLLNEKIPEIENVTFVIDRGKQFIAHIPENDPENSTPVEANFIWANQAIFDVFTFSFIQGTPQNALNIPFTVVLTESTSKKLFHDAYAIGKTIQYEGHEYTITGVIQDVRKSHIEIDALFSHVSIESVYPDRVRNIHWISHNSWLWNGTYLLFREDINLKEIEIKIDEVLSEINDGTYMNHEFNRFHIRPLADVYFNGNVLNLPYGLHGNFKLILILLAIGAFLLLLACINYVNLTTARSIIRLKEVAVKRITGSTVGQLRYQLIIESVVVALISMLVAVTIIQVGLPIFNRLAQVDVKGIGFQNPIMLTLLLGGTILIGALAGLYPAFYLTRNQPIRIVKGIGVNGSAGSYSRSLLMTIQFALSIIMIVAIIVNLRQLHYVRSADMGFTKDHIITVLTPRDVSNPSESRKLFKERLLLISGIDKVAYSSSSPGFDAANAPIHEIEGRRVSFKFFACDVEYLDLMGIVIKNGRGFFENIPADKVKWLPNSRVGGAIFNETAIKEFGIDNPIGKKFWSVENNFEWEITGVVKDFHVRSLHDKIEPMSIIWDSGLSPLANIKIAATDIQETLKKIQVEWNNVYGQKPFVYNFLDENFDRQYKSDEQLANVIGYFTAIAVIIACLGLFALSSFMVSRRVKEIGVRKVLGASVGTIYSMLSWDFIKWILVAIVIATPVAWYLMKMWLNTFAYHIDLGVDVFVIAALIAIGIALLTVTGQSLKVARANPVDSLKYE